MSSYEAGLSVTTSKYDQYFVPGCFNVICGTMGRQAVLKPASAVHLLRSVLGTIKQRHPFQMMGYVFLPVVLVLGATTFSGLPTILAVMACCLMMIGRLQQDLMRMRGIQLCASPFGAAHDIVVGAWPCLAGTILSFIVAAAAFRRERMLRATA